MIEQKLRQLVEILADPEKINPELDTLAENIRKEDLINWKLSPVTIYMEALLTAKVLELYAKAFEEESKELSIRANVMLSVLNDEVRGCMGLPDMFDQREEKNKRDE